MVIWGANHGGSIESVYGIYCVTQLCHVILSPEGRKYRRLVCGRRGGQLEQRVARRYTLAESRNSCCVWKCIERESNHRCLNTADFNSKGSSKPGAGFVGTLSKFAPEMKTQYWCGL